MQNLNAMRIVLFIIAVGGLVIIYLFQNYNYASLFLINSWPVNFVINKTIRFLLNDLLAILLIFALFNKKDYLIISVIVQFFGVLFILIPYLYIKLNYPSHIGVFVSFLHRLVINPVLLILLIPAFYLVDKVKTQKNAV